ncbi:hypothetical protein HOY82DRAFT_352963 [Tuber indicum]|nr:hypothetical protein HOY82DRAFT_352963 [Tuber indicum]
MAGIRRIVPNHDRVDPHSGPIHFLLNFYFIFHSFFFIPPLYTRARALCKSSAIKCSYELAQKSRSAAASCLLPLHNILPPPPQHSHSTSGHPPPRLLPSFLVLLCCTPPAFGRDSQEPFLFEFLASLIVHPAGKRHLPAECWPRFHIFSSFYFPFSF